MKTYILNIIPSIQRFSEKLDNLAMLTNQHWVVFDEIKNSKNVYIFRTNKELLLSKDGRVSKANWDYIGNNTLLIEIGEESYLFRHGFFDQNILALKLDGKKDEYALLVNESKYNRELNSLDKITDFLSKIYLQKNNKPGILNKPEFNTENKSTNELKKEKKWMKYSTKKGEIKVEIHSINKFPWDGDSVLLDGQVAPDGKYKLGSMFYIKTQNGIVTKVSWI